MKKLFALLTTTILASFCFVGGTKEPMPHYAETETSENVASSSEPSSEPSSEQESSESEQEPLVVDQYVDEISQTAKDVIEVIKTVLNQPIVIGGVSVTLGTVIFWLFGKFIAKVLDNRSTKTDNKIKDVLKKLGFTDEQIAKLFSNYELIYKVLLILVENTKNVNVKELCLATLNGGEKEIKQVENKVAEQIEQQVENISSNSTEKIKELLNK